MSTIKVTGSCPLAGTSVQSKLLAKASASSSIPFSSSYSSLESTVSQAATRVAYLLKAISRPTIVPAGGGPKSGCADPSAYPSPY